MILPDSLFTQASLFPEKMDLVKREIYFCNMTEKSYRESPFLDHRTVKQNSEELILDIDQLIAENTIAQPDATHFIFHNAFCCSTLFSRCLNAVESALVLREPNILMELSSVYRFHGTQMMPLMDQQFLEKMFNFISGMMARRFENNNLVFIKPTDSFNNLMSASLEMNSKNTGLIIYSDIEHFLTAIFKYPQRAEWAKLRSVELSLDEMRLHGRVKVNPEILSLPQRTALVWVLHMNKFKKLLASETGSKVKTINNEVFMKSPVSVITKYLDFIGFALETNGLNEAVSEVMKGHSKDSEQSYSNEQRENEYLEARNKFDNQIQESMSWASEVFGDDAIMCDLANKLT